MTGENIALSKKRKIYGIDPLSYENEAYFYNVVNQKICEVCDRKITNISRHLEANKKKYKELLLSADPNFGCIDSNYKNRDKLLYWSDPDGKFDTLLVNDYLEWLCSKDLDSEDGIISIIDFIRREYLLLVDMNRDKGGNYIKRPNDILYLEVAATLSDNRDLLNYEHPIFTYERYTDRFKESIDLLLQIRSLQKQIEHYSAIRQVPSNAFFEYVKRNDSWNAIMQLPYWIRMGRRTKRSCYHPTSNLFMIKPGTEIFDEGSIRYFVRKKDKKFEQKCRIKCDKMTVAIPDSLDETSLLEVIDFAHENAKDLKFVCQSGELATKVKMILVSRELSARKESVEQLDMTTFSKQKYYIGGNYWVDVDPNYYNAFFVNTPNNENVWNRYGFNNGRANIDLRTLIDVCIEEHYRNEGSLNNMSKLQNGVRSTYGSDCFYFFTHSEIEKSVEEEKGQKNGAFVLIKKMAEVTSVGKNN